MKWLKQDWIKVGLGIVILILGNLFFVKQISQMPLVSDGVEEPTLPKKISWEGKVISFGMYGRLRINKLVISDEYPDFIAEPTDTIFPDKNGSWSDSIATKNIKVGNIVRITGEWIDTTGAGLPFVMIEKIDKLDR